ncbi:hypothetical protein RvY_17870 [Ramazzottius varieornatus]|uniref:Uncharacterized protein n=1 Tax=Ramazzottius varieornatus TaxID=947166 RepID=A0A1D1W3Q8_RAMVA|nr:hypothetical protein RvY_17870 [Ramazzottius varieornatus]
MLPSDDAYRRNIVTIGDNRRQSFLNDREWRRTAVGDDITIRVAHVRRHFHCFSAHKSEEGHLDITEFIEIKDAIKKKVDVFLERTVNEPLKVPDRLPVDDVELPPIGTDVDFSEIEAHILAASSLKNVRHEHKGWGRRRRVRKYHKSYCVPPLYEELEKPSKWTPEVEDVYRFRAAGYRDETHFRVVNGPSVPVNRCARTGLISKLPNKRNHYHPLIFSENIECDFAEIRKVKIPRYCWNFLEHDFYLAALFHMRMTAVQNKAIAEAEKVRKLLVEKIRKERKHKKHHKQLQKDPSIKVEDDDGGGGGGKEKSAKKKHKKSKK